MNKTTRDAMTPGNPADVDVPVGVAIAAEDSVDEALRVMIERDAQILPVTDGREIIGSVTTGKLAISIEDTWTWSTLCR
jgi:CBS domain-containing protein